MFHRGDVVLFPTVFRLSVFPVCLKYEFLITSILQRHIADLVEKYSVLHAPESSKKQESKKSPKEIISFKREQGEKKLEPMYTIKSTDKAALE
ncbi:hypothetical protein Tco_1459676 [Tanacetum coccineum]